MQRKTAVTVSSSAPAVTRRKKNSAPAVTRRKKNSAPAITRRKKNSAPAITRCKKSIARISSVENPSRQLDAFSVKKMLVLAGTARAENPFLTAFSRKKLVKAVPAERVRLKRKSNNKATF
ncbi:hypothetical protein [Evansella clarkii]|uniref:hypothetical protein n=1 Tax=Evansella clarkii TaxID=79879 RepID=UPI001115B1EC|nr:hypothetical protein [Evansella clarkii]